MIKIREKNLNLLKKNNVYSESQEHDACGVGLVASTEGKKSRKVVEYGIEALKAVWHRGAVDADGKTGDGAGIHVEIPQDFFIEKIENTGHSHHNSEFSLKADIVIKALGFDPENLPYLFNENNLQITRWGTIKTDFDTMETNLQGVFAAGDIVRGASLVVWAIRDGRDAAASIETYLKHKNLNKKKVA